MNIAQLSEQLKDVPQNRLIDYARNPNSVVPQFLALAEIQRRQQLSAQVAPPAATVAEDVLSQAQPTSQMMQPQAAQMAQQLPENQPGVAQLPTGMPQGMAAGGIVAFADGGLSDEEDDDKELARLFPRSSLSEFQDMISSIPAGVRSLVNKLPKSYEETKREQSYSEPSGKGSHKYEQDVIKEAKRQGIDPNLALHVLYKETGNLKDPESARSKAGALGIMQLMPSTAKELGVNPMDPYENIRGGVSYLKKMYDKYGDARLAAAAYNAGPGNVDRALRRAGGLDTLSGETRNYIAGLAQGGAIKGYAGTDGESLVDASDDEARNPLAFLNPADLFSSVKNYAMKNWEKNKALREGTMTPDMAKAAAAKEELERERSRANATANVNKRDIASGNLQSPVMANAAPSDQDFRDFDQAAALFQAENANRPVAPQVEQKSKADLYAEALEKDLEARAAKAKEAGDMNAYLALMQAGLAMMASRSPYALGGIGEGGQQGLAAYGALRKQQADEEKDIMATRLGLYKYGAASEAAKKEYDLKMKAYADRLGMSSAELAEKIRAHDIEQAKANEANAVRVEQMLRNSLKNNFTMTDEQKEQWVMNHPLMKKAYSKLDIDMSQIGTPGAPPVGTIKGGYKFKGGNPNEEKNWEKI